jgi:type II secretory pathway pseudopilin PulG
MKIKLALFSRLRRRLAAFSLIEATVGMGVIGAVVGAMITGITTGTFTMRMARENLRATQIMLEKVETIRLYSWSQVTSPGFIPQTFQATYDPQGAPNVGLTYNGTLTVGPIDPAQFNSSYIDDMRQVTVHLAWQTGGIQRSRDFTSYISRNGLQDYVY